MEVKLKKIAIEYKNKDGETCKGYNYYVVTNGVNVCIKPVYNSDYNLLKLIAED